MFRGVIVSSLPRRTRVSHPHTPPSLSLSHSTAHLHSTAEQSTTHHSTAHRSTAQHSTAQHSTVQHTAAQHNTAQQV
eukprot:2290813-Pyramimonas_sp.AAC.1